MSNEVAATAAQEKKIQTVPTPEELIFQAIEKGLTVDTIERLVALKERMDAAAAKRAFDSDMAAFQSECPIIEKAKAVKNKEKTTIRYKYAPLEEIIDQTRELRQKHGFSHSFDTEVVEKEIKVWCIIKHRGGHSERSSFAAPIDSEAYMNMPQKSASAMTYAKRYAFINTFGITMGDEDTDAVNARDPKAKATPEQKAEITRLAGKAGITQAEVAQKVRENYGISFVDITPVQAEGVIAGLKKKIVE